MYLLVFHAYINETHGPRSKTLSKKSRPYIYAMKFLDLLGAPYIFDISRLRVKNQGKAIPLQALTGPESSRRLRLPDFKTIGT
jgi:hypothetical protein